MTNKFNEDRGSAGKAEEQIREARMLASRLQRAINTGRSTLSKMREVDKFVSHYLTTKMASILQIIDNLAKGARSVIIKEELNKIYIKLLDFFNEFKLMEDRGYGTTVGSGGTLDVNKLNNLIDVDTDLLSIVALLYEFVEKISLKKSTNVNERIEILHILNDIVSALRRRDRIMKTVGQRKVKRSQI
jgi:signal transduction histidine kinase